jgi:hypothetical protein
MLAGNTSDKTTLRGFLDRIERQYGKAKRVWLMDRGVPTEETLAEMRAADPPVSYLVGTPKGAPRPRLRPIRGHLKPSPRATSRVPMPREEWIEIPVPPIVDPAVFEAVRA